MKQFTVTDLRYDTPPPPPGLEGVPQVRVILRGQDDGLSYYIILPNPAPCAIGDNVEFPAESVTLLPDPTRPL